jgi:hypothetical protein
MLEKVYLRWYELQQILKIIRTKYMLLLETRHLACCLRLICGTAIVGKVESLPKPTHHPLVIVRKALSSAKRNTTTRVLLALLDLFTLNDLYPDQRRLHFRRCELQALQTHTKLFYLLRTLLGSSSN